jgi:mono/diheme cytochrome c family protein
MTMTITADTTESTVYDERTGRGGTPARATAFGTTDENAIMTSIGLWRRSASAAAAVVLLMLLPRHAAPFPVDGDQAVLPAGSELNEDALDLPREVLRSESRGDRVSYVVGLGDLAFKSPGILGDVARRAGISCATCHVNGASNAKLFVPGLSTRPGNFDTTGALFNPKADNHVLDPVRIPSLRGARYLAPYGHDGRIASLRDFVRNVIVGEFAGPEPSPAILDALVAYIQEIDFLPNEKLGPRGRLNDQASEAERRGEALFSKPFPHDPNLSCAACHVPSGAFIDHLQHDVGSGGLFKTPTLLNASFNAPYFHDARYETFDQVVDHFDRVFGLGLSAEQRSDLLAYLRAIGGAFQPYDRDTVEVRFNEISMFSLVLAQAIAANDREAIDLAVDTLGGELRDLTERFPDHRDTAITGALVERRLARAALKDVVISLRRIAMATAAGDLAVATAEYRTYYDRTFSRAMPLLRGTQPWSLFNPALREAHDAERRRMLRVPAQVQR